MRLDAIGFGALNIDKLYRVNRMASKGEESYIRGYNESLGGSAANTIVGLARLGLNVSCIWKVSKDREGEILGNYMLLPNFIHSRPPFVDIIRVINDMETI